MKKKIIYLMSLPLTSRNFERFGIQRWIDFNWEIEVLILSKSLFPDYYNKVISNTEIISKKFVKVFENNKEASDYISKIEKVFYINITFNSDFEKSLLSLMENNRSIGIFYRTGIQPMPFFEYNGKKIKTLLRHSKNLIRNFTNKLKKIQKNNYIIIHGRQMKKIFPNYNKIYCHSPNYDFKIKSKFKPKEKKYLCYIDQSIFYSPEIELFKSAKNRAVLDKQGQKDMDNLSNLSQDNFYKSINNFLKKNQDYFKIEVLILAHQNLGKDIEKLNKLYDFRVISNSTYEYVRQSKIVFGHYSFALEFAIMEQIPLSIIITDDLKKTYIHNKTKAISNYLDIKLINIDKIKSNFNYKNQLKYNKVKYDKYIDNFIKTKNSLDKFSWDIIREKLENNFNL